MLCSKLHYQKVSKLEHISYKSGGDSLQVDDERARRLIRPDLNANKEFRQSRTNNQATTIQAVQSTPL